MQESKISCLTAYDALTANIFDSAGIDMMLVGDSLGNVFQGEETTLPVTLETDNIPYESSCKRGKQSIGRS